MKEKDKINIAENLIKAIETGIAVNDKTRTFVANWICSGPEEKSSDMQDVWDIVLKNYYPKERPVLFRATDYINDGKIESYTGRIGVAEVFLRQCGKDAKLLICDTDESIVPEYIRGKGDYRGTFFPLSKLLANEMELEDSLFVKNFMRGYIGEDEYIMRTELDLIYVLREDK
ncbi:MAG: hypothetical protein ACLTBU_12280 [Zhenhengia sp.]|uniref:hypothetical protein n=1 Tax=Zhenhengia sp. TaxID=2944208 RepID=UPI003991F0E5